MSQFRNAIQRSDQHIKSLRIACAFLILLVLITSAGWMLAPRSMTIHNPPDLRTGSTRPWWEVPPSSVYAFAFYIFQQLNAWPKNGEVDYPAKIRALSPYLTPGCKDFLERDATERTDTSWDSLLDEYFFVKFLCPQTEWSYRKVVNGFRKYYGLDRKLSEITRRDVQEWRRHVINVEESSAVTWNNKVAHMRAIVNYAMKANLIPQTENPFNEVLVRADDKRKKTLSKPQLTRVYLLMQQHVALDPELSVAEMKRCALHPAWFWTAVLDTLRYTGMRVNQLMHVRLMDINLDENWIELRLDGSKTHREWRVPIVGPLKPQLQVLISRAIENGAKSTDAIFDVNRFLWTEKEREKLPPVATLQPVKSFFRRLSKDCGFAVSPHRFRHTLATELMKSPDRNLQMVKGLLGHRSITTTMGYIDINLDVTCRTLESELGLYLDKRLIR